ncbi:MAG: RNA polymerase sigma factor RpoH [Hyphomicrobiales bacterium]|nr:RNA polymerase sigma factor RpoH [Hyphomicrobiales bacterium]
MTSAPLPALSNEAGLSSYLGRIRNYPMLEVGEERLLARRWREKGDPAAAHKLITSHLRLVAMTAMRYRGYGLPIGEIVSEGNVGLVQAVKRFEPDRGFRLATYAMWWIKASIQEYVVRSWSLVRIGTTANQKKLFFNLRRAKARILAIGDEDLRSDQVQELSAQLGVPEQDVVEMNPRMRGDVSLNVPLREDGQGELQDWLVDDRASQEWILVSEEEQQNRLLTLRDALITLAPRERRIFEARRLVERPIKLEELAIEFRVTRERVRQIEVRAFEKVRKAVRTNLAKPEASKHGQDATAASPERRSRPFPQGSRMPQFEQQHA